MSRINWSRVIVGGLVAGVVYTVFDFVFYNLLVQGQWQAALTKLGKTMSNGADTIVIWIVLAFIFGIASVWVYAAMRPRFGAGAGTALRAGIAIWIFSGLAMAVALCNSDLMPATLMTIAGIWTFIKTIVATECGAWLYKETKAE